MAGSRQSGDEGGGSDRRIPAINAKPTTLLLSAAVRAVLLFALWLALAGWNTIDAVAGLVAACLASWASFFVLPPTAPRRGSLIAAVQIVVSFPFQSLVAGFDVARRAFSPRMPLRPGLVACPMRLKGETSCNVLRALMSLQPGSLPVEQQADGTLLIHCLDSHEPIRERYTRDEALFAKAAGSDVAHS